MVWLFYNGIYSYDYSRNKFAGYYTAFDYSKRRYFINAKQDPVQPGFIWMSYTKTLSNEPLGVCRFNTVDRSITIYKHDAKDVNSISGNNILAYPSQILHIVYG